MNEQDRSEYDAFLERMHAAEAEAKALREEQYGVGNVWNTEEVQKVFEVISFLSPFARVRRKADNVVGWVTFDHSPRVYYDFRPS